MREDICATARGITGCEQSVHSHGVLRAVVVTGVHVVVVCLHCVNSGKIISGAASYSVRTWQVRHTNKYLSDDKMLAQCTVKVLSTGLWLGEKLQRKMHAVSK